ncbi:glycosyltransferase [Polynucleobacter sp. Adler-ghost]|uniref:MraY family glycosyltransferase n=1 Tax=Polynucleobacter sp. Adler-ghost TaxID=2770234 RepID=UPI001BFE4961|nr:glycosyltransferase [Polynucleobacter sp. Adler-ghost]QWE31070.1 glycosyltransferase family 4 protein [Polynucleobacter sp. Adler-ghost]
MKHPIYSDVGVLIGLSTLPCFAIGLAEDVTKKIGVKLRLAVTIITAVIGVQLIGIQISYINIPGIDNLLSYSIVAIPFTAVAIAGLSNSYNLIDGFNGLSSMVGIITLVGLGFIGFKVNDYVIISLCLILCGSILGFFIWNYPRGLIFMGDGGAYFIGLWIGFITLALVYRNNVISPWLGVLINGYPIMETLYTIYRRVVIQGKNPGHADGMHFHTLIFRRLQKHKLKSNKKITINTNARTSHFFWVSTGLCVMASIFLYESTELLIICIILFSIIYVNIYSRVIKFKTPAWLYIFK